MESTHASPESVYTHEDVEARSETNQQLTTFGASVGSIALAIQHVLIEAHLQGWLVLAITITSLLGWAVFAVGVIRNKKLGKTVEGRLYFESARRDERLISIRARAFAFGFGMMLGAQVILLVLWTLLGQPETGLLTIPVAASSTIAAGISGAVLRHHILMSR